MGRMRQGAGLRDRLRRLEEAAKRETMTLVCPVCAAEFVAHGDVPMEVLGIDIGASSTHAGAGDEGGA